MFYSVKKPAIVSVKFFDITPFTTMNCSFGSFDNLRIRRNLEVDCMSSVTLFPPDFKSAINFSETYALYELWPKDWKLVLAKTRKKYATPIQWIAYNYWSTKSTKKWSLDLESGWLGGSNDIFATLNCFCYRHFRNSQGTNFLFCWITKKAQIWPIFGLAHLIADNS